MAGAEAVAEIQKTMMIDQNNINNNNNNRFRHLVFVAEAGKELRSKHNIDRTNDELGLQELENEIKIVHELKSKHKKKFRNYSGLLGEET